MTDATGERECLPLSLNITVDPATSAKLLDFVQKTLQAALKTIQAAGATSASPAPPPPPVESSTTPSQSWGTEVKPQDRIKAADLRTALLLGKIPEDTGLLIDTKTFARLLSISSRHLIRLQDMKAVPEPVHLGRLIRWPLAEVLAWIEADCPPQREWATRKHESSEKREK